MIAAGLDFGCEDRMRDALIKAYNCIYFALPSSRRQMGPSTCELAAKLFLEKKGSQDDPMRLAYCSFCVAALEGDCPLENAAVMSPCVCQLCIPLEMSFQMHTTLLQVAATA